jgi:hypothetical protein
VSATVNRFQSKWTECQEHWLWQTSEDNLTSDSCNRSRDCNTKTKKTSTYKIIIFAVVLYGCETLSPVIREELRLRVFENRVLKRIFRPKRDEVMWGWIKLHDEGLHNLCFSPSIKEDVMAGHVAWMTEKSNARIILVGKSKGKRPLGKPWRRWVNDIKMDLREIGWGGMNWIDLA